MVDYLTDRSEILSLIESHQSFIFFAWSPKDIYAYNQAMSDIDYHQDNFGDLRKTLFSSTVKRLNPDLWASYNGYYSDSINIGEFLIYKNCRDIVRKFYEQVDTLPDLHIYMIWLRGLWICYMASGNKVIYDMILKLPDLNDKNKHMCEVYIDKYRLFPLDFNRKN